MPSREGILKSELMYAALMSLGAAPSSRRGEEEPTGPNPPVITSAATVDFVENAVATAYFITATGGDGPLVYSIEGGADLSFFDFNGTTGEVSFGTPPNFENPDDANADNVYELIVGVSDGVNPVVTQAVSITVTDLVGLLAGVLDTSVGYASNDAIGALEPTALNGWTIHVVSCEIADPIEESLLVVTMTPDFIPQGGWTSVTFEGPGVSTTILSADATTYHASILVGGIGDATSWFFAGEVVEFQPGETYSVTWDVAEADLFLDSDFEGVDGATAYGPDAAGATWQFNGAELESDGPVIDGTSVLWTPEESFVYATFVERVSNTDLWECTGKRVFAAGAIGSVAVVDPEEEETLLQVRIDQAGGIVQVLGPPVDDPAGSREITGLTIPADTVLSITISWDGVDTWQVTIPEISLDESGTGALSMLGYKVYIDGETGDSYSDTFRVEGVGVGPPPPKLTASFALEDNYDAAITFGVASAAPSGTPTFVGTPVNSGAFSVELHAGDAVTASFDNYDAAYTMEFQTESRLEADGQQLRLTDSVSGAYVDLIVTVAGLEFEVTSDGSTVIDSGTVVGVISPTAWGNLGIFIAGGVCTVAAQTAGISAIVTIPVGFLPDQFRISGNGATASYLDGFNISSVPA